MNRPMKSRVWDTKDLKWRDDAFVRARDGDIQIYGYDSWEKAWTVWALDSGRLVATQFTGLLDSKGGEIWEGDIMRYYVPARSTQTHYGDNIPGPAGSYTEQLEPYIETKIRAVRFLNGAFTFDTEEEVAKNGFTWPFDMHRSLYLDTEDLMRAFDCRRTQAWIDNGDDETGDCSYLCGEYGLADEAALIKHLNTFEVIGNIFENSDLLK